MEREDIKMVVWVGSSLEDLRSFPDVVKDEIGYALHRAQEGKKHHNAKPLKGFSGVLEIISSKQTDAYRAVYAVKIGDNIYVLHTFKKKSKTGIKTPKPDIDMIKKRLQEARILAQEEEDGK
ncbi:MAG: addiction module toxin RelE [Candidatus Electrothrix sp. EH2]|nr:addiction module toxin RelE [Candidatus Electrothrix sp. EH2]